jgi:hypothetical protein
MSDDQWYTQRAERRKQHRQAAKLDHAQAAVDQQPDVMQHRLQVNKVPGQRMEWHCGVCNLDHHDFKRPNCRKTGCPGLRNADLVFQSYHGWHSGNDDAQPDKAHKQQTANGQNGQPKPSNKNADPQPCYICTCPGHLAASCPFKDVEEAVTDATILHGPPDGATKSTLMNILARHATIDKELKEIKTRDWTFGPQVAVTMAEATEKEREKIPKYTFATPSDNAAVISGLQKQIQRRQKAKATCDNSMQEYQ